MALKKIILRIDAAFLGLAGFFGVVSDVLSYYAGKGAFGEVFHKNPFVIASVEAHFFGVMTAGFMWYLATRGNLGNWMAIFAHLICGISNIIWFDVFGRVNANTQGIVVTVLHFLFVFLNALLIYKNKTAQPTDLTESKA